MNKNAILSAWKKTEDSASMESVAGIPVVDENLLRLIGGGFQPPFPVTSSGFFCTISGECNGGRSCW